MDSELAQLRQEICEVRDRQNKADRELQNLKHEPSGKTGEEDKREIVKDSVGELRDRERRKTNLLLFNVEESGAEEIQDRKQHDLQKVDSVLEELKLQGEVGVENSVRLARSKLPQHADKPRPLRVTLGSQEERTEVLKKATQCRRPS